MPIAGLTDKQTDFGAGFPQIAKLYKGAPKNDKGWVGKDLTYFRVEFLPEFAHLEPVWRELYGDTPDEFQPVFLARQTTDEAFETWMEGYNAANAMIRRCTGERMVGWRTEDDGRWQSDPVGIACQCEHERKQAEAQGKEYKPLCQRSGRLNLVLPDFVEASGVLGYVSIVLHSFYDIMAVYNTLSELEQLHGRLSGIALVFGRAVRQIHVPNPKKEGKRMQVKKSLVYLRPTADFTRNRLIPALTNPTPPPALPTPSPADSITTEQARDAFGNTGSRRIGASNDSPTGDTWIPIDRLLVEITEEGGYLYRLARRDGESIITDNLDAFLDAGIENCGNWDYPNVVEFEPPLQVQATDHLGMQILTAIRPYDGEIAVDLGKTTNPFM